MPLNKTHHTGPDAPPANGDAVDAAALTGATPLRRRLLADVLAELVALRPERMGTFRALHRGSLSLIHAHLLMLLDRGGPLSMGQIAELLDVSVASATGIVDRLEKRGLVARRRDEADRRVVLVDATDEGRALVHETEREHREALEAVLGELSDEELSGFLSALRSIHRARERYLAQHGIVPGAGHPHHAK